MKISAEDLTLSNAGLIIGTIALAILVNQYYQRMRVNCPGGFEWPFICNLNMVSEDPLGKLAWHAINVFKGDTFTVKLPLIPRFIIIHDPDCVEHILKSHFNNYVKGPHFHENLKELLGDGIFNVDGEKWKNQRKMASHMFSATEFRNKMTTTFRNHAEELLHKFESAKENQTTLDAHDLFHRFTLDSIGEIAFGVNIQSMVQPDTPFAKSFNQAQQIVEKRFFNPFWKLLYYFDPDAKTLQRLVKVMDEYAYGLIRQRKENKEYTTKEDVLSRFLKVEDENGNPQYTDKELRDVIMNFLIAGRDTTAQALSWTVFLVCQHPEVEARMVEEIRSVLGEGQVPTYDQTRKMTYVPAVVKEALRLYPSVPKDAKLAVHDDTLPDGTFVPSNSYVVYFPYAMGRLSKLWKDPEQFNPQRFVDEPAPSMFRYPVFQAGPRTCLGQNMALFEATTILTALYNQYHLELIDKDSVKPLNSLTLPMQNELQVKVSAQA